MTSAPEPLWPDALAAAETMAAWAQLRVRTPGTGHEPDAVRLLALAVWRVAADQGVPVADAVLDSAVFVYLRRPERLFAPPFPSGVGPLPTLEGRFDPALGLAGRIMDDNHLQHSPGELLGGTDDGLLDARTVGERLAEIAQDARDQPPLPETETVNACTSAAAHALNRREWLPTETECTVACTADKALRGLHPGLSGVDERMWLARLRRLAHGGLVLRGLADQHRPDLSPLLIELLAATADLLEAVTEPVAGLESAWSARPEQQRLPAWERRHVPLGLRARVVDAEHTAGFVVGSTLTATYTGDVDY